MRIRLNSHPAVGAGALVFGLYISGIGGMMIDSLGQHIAKMAKEHARIERVRSEGNEQFHATVCPEYFKASWFGRNWSRRNLNWCEEYRPRVSHERIEL